MDALRLSKEQLSASFSEELNDVSELLSQGFSEKTRLRGVGEKCGKFQW